MRRSIVLKAYKSKINNIIIVIYLSYQKNIKFLISFILF